MQHPKYVLAAYGISPRKSLGQNFLSDEGILQRIVEAAEIKAGDHVLEIGPGLGALTSLLAREAERVVAVELDDRLMPVLRAQLDEIHNVSLIHGDILELDAASLFSHGTFKVVANIPYYITGVLLRHLLSGPGKPVRLVLTLQKEVAERIAAAPGDMSLLSVSVRFYGDVSVEGTIKAGAFWPRPEVDSAILCVDLQRGPLLPLDEEEDFFRVVRTGFSQKRKQLQKNLRQLGFARRDVMERLRSAGVDGRKRAEDLTLDQWVSVYRAMTRDARDE